MKIILIQQAETDMNWDARYDSTSYERAVGEELGRGIAPLPVRRGDASAYRVYTGTTRAASETAELLFDLPEPPERTPLLDDVPLRAFRDTETPRPLWMWRALGRAQWALGGGRQPEDRRTTARRAEQLADLLEAGDRDCVVICRGLTMTALKAALRRRGYCLQGGGLRPRPLDRIRAAKQSLHCGGCNHNCLLSDPKCEVGRNKAKEKAAPAKDI